MPVIGSGESQKFLCCFFFWMAYSECLYGPQHPQHHRQGRAWDVSERECYLENSRETQTLGSFFQHIPPEATPEDTTFSRLLVAQVTLAESREVLPPCGRFFELQVPERSFWWLRVSRLTRHEELQSVRVGKQCRETKKNSKEGGWVGGSQFPEFNFNLMNMVYLFFLFGFLKSTGKDAPTSLILGSYKSKQPQDITCITHSVHHQTSYTQVTRGREGMGGKAPSYLFRGMRVGNGTSRPGRTVWRFLKTLKTELPHGCQGKP